MEILQKIRGYHSMNYPGMGIVWTTNPQEVEFLTDILELDPTNNYQPPKDGGVFVLPHVMRQIEIRSSIMRAEDLKKQLEAKGFKKY